MFKKTLLCASVLALSFGSNPVLASETMTMEQIQAQLQSLSNQVQHLSKVVEEQNSTIQRQAVELEQAKKESAQAIQQQAAQLEQAKEESAEAIANIKPAAGGVDTSAVKISMKPAPKIESADGKYSFQPLARMHLDVTHFDDDASDRSSNTDIRRARLGAKGKLGDDLSYKAEVDFGGDVVALTDFYLKYSGFGVVDLVAGHQRPKMGLQQQTSSNNIRLLERSAPINALLQGRRLGLNVLAGDDHWSLGAGVFGEGAGVTNQTDDEDTSIEGRASANVLGLFDPDTKNVVHVGGGYSHRRLGDNQARFRARPGTGDGPRIVDTGVIANTDTVDVFGLEAAGVFGPFSAQAEYIRSDLSRDSGAQDAKFDGYYVQAGYILTGETRGYKGKSGKFGGVKPKKPFNLKDGGIGAVEVVGRIENLDLNDGGIAGGEVDILTGGVNWHLNNNVRIMANIISVDSDGNAVVPNDDPTIYSMRTQWNF